MRAALTGLPRSWKRVLLLSFDLAVIWFSLWLAISFRLGFQGVPQPINTFFLLFTLAPLCTLPYFIHAGLYSSVTRYSDFEMIGSVARATLYGLVTLLVILFLWPNKPVAIPRSIPIIYWSISAFLIAGGRYWIGAWLHGHSLKSVLYRLLGMKRSSTERGIPVAIYGAGSGGRQLVAALRKGIVFRPVAFIDDDKSLRNSLISGLKVYSPRRIDKMIKQTGAQEIFLAIPSAARSARKQIIERLEPHDLHIRTIPNLEELAQGHVKIEEVREVSIADILGREAVPPKPELFEPCVKGKVVMVTGAGGSIGSELCRQITAIGPKRLLLFENSEYNLYKIHGEVEDICAQTGSDAEVIPVLGSVTQPWRLLEIMRKFQVETLYHAAAYKHVPMVEFNSHHGFRNNVLGTLYTAQAAVLTRVKNFVLISTDKAVRPTNMMGASKRMAELVLQAFSQEQSLSFFNPEKYGLTPETQVVNHTRFTMVRFGNVLDSSGSVVPLFREQIKNGGPVTVTHPDIIRYFMTIPEAAQLVIQAGAMGEGGDVFVLDMGDAVKIDDLARKLVRLSGLSVKDEENPNGDIEIQYTGLRPGEKLFEELLIGENVYITLHPKIRRASEMVMEWPDLYELIQVISEAFHRNNYQSIRKMITLQPAIGYLPSDDISDWLFEVPESETAALV